MKITINGQPHALEGPMSIGDLLQHLGYQNPFVAVAVNHNCIPRNQFSEHHISDQDAVEIVAPMAGG
jgi:sulfur carrier protein